MRKHPFDSPQINLRVAVAQMKFSRSIDENLENIRDAISAAKRQRAQAILFPECATTGYGYAFDQLRPDTVRSTLFVVSLAAAESGLDVLIGSPVFGKDGRLFNGLVVIDHRGRFVHCYAKCQLTAADRTIFSPGNHVALFRVRGVLCTSIICHERRYPELVRIPVMAGAQILFHPNAGMDALTVSKSKRAGRDGSSVRAFENAIYYLFANSVGPQGGRKWSAGDSKIVAPDGTLLALADNENGAVLAATLDLNEATRKYARESLAQPRFLRAFWQRIVHETRQRAKKSREAFDLP